MRRALSADRPGPIVGEAYGLSEKPNGAPAGLPGSKLGAGAAGCAARTGGAVAPADANCGKTSAAHCHCDDPLRSNWHCGPKRPSVTQLSSCSFVIGPYSCPSSVLTFHCSVAIARGTGGRGPGSDVFEFGPGNGVSSDGAASEVTVWQAGQRTALPAAWSGTLSRLPHCGH